MSALNLIPVVLYIVCIVVWIRALIRWDGEAHCKPEDCKTCPFPCKGHNHKNK